MTKDEKVQKLSGLLSAAPDDLINESWDWWQAQLEKRAASRSSQYATMTLTATAADEDLVRRMEQAKPTELHIMRVLGGDNVAHLAARCRAQGWR